MNSSPEILSSLRHELKRNSDENARAASQRFFKEKVHLYGVKSAIVKKLAIKFFKIIQHKSKAEIILLCENLLESGLFEEALVAYTWAEKLGKVFEPYDFAVLEKWVTTYVTNWASCDTLCNHTVGSFIEKYPAFVKNLKIWAVSSNRWVRRAAAVTLILPTRKGLFLTDVFEIAQILLHDNDDLVQKGYGWMLKEASRIHQAEVFSFVMSNKQKMPRIALRYAIEKMPEPLQKKAMEKN